MTTSTYGVLPSWRDFDDAFDDVVDDDHGFFLRLGRSDADAAEGTSIGDGYYSARELYRGLEELIEKGDEAWPLADAILSSLGFEWD